MILVGISTSIRSSRSLHSDLVGTESTSMKGEGRETSESRWTFAEKGL